MVYLSDALAKNIIKAQKWKTTKLHLLGAGVNGRVYNVGTKAMKLMKGTSSKEYLAMLRLRGTKFIPKVKNGSFYTNTSKGVSAFLMNKLPSSAITLKKFHEMYGNKADPTETSKKAYVIKAMHIRGISHGDLHTGNIMVTHTGPKINRMWVIDFGRSIRIPKGHTENSVYRVLRKITGYNSVYGKLYGNKNAPSRPNTQLNPNVVTGKKRSRRQVVKKVLGLSPSKKNMYYKSAAYTAYTATPV
jgi:RIO-like serine/threonine protein kinase